MEAYFILKSWGMSAGKKFLLILSFLSGNLSSERMVWEGMLCGVSSSSSFPSSSSGSS